MSQRLRQATPLCRNLDTPSAVFSASLFQSRFTFIEASGMVMKIKSGATMGALLFRSPRTEHEVDIGIETDPGSLSTIRFFSVRGYCPHCRDTHDWNISDGRSDEPCQTQQTA